MRIPFVLKPKAKNSNIKQFDIRVDANGVLKNFSTTEKMVKPIFMCCATLQTKP